MGALLEAAKQMLDFIKAFPKSKADGWPTPARQKEWEEAIKEHEAISRLWEEEFDKAIKEGLDRDIKARQKGDKR